MDTQNFSEMLGAVSKSFKAVGLEYDVNVYDLMNFTSNLMNELNAVPPFCDYSNAVELGEWASTNPAVMEEFRNAEIGRTLIPVVKKIREMTGCSLREAKNAYDACHPDFALNALRYKLTGSYSR